MPEQFINGLTATVSLQGRAQIVPDQYINNESPGGLTFYLDGAHSPESMEICARWFSLSTKANSQDKAPDSSRSHNFAQSHTDVKAKNSQVSTFIIFTLFMFVCIHLC